MGVGRFLGEKAGPFSSRRVFRKYSSRALVGRTKSLGFMKEGTLRDWLCEPIRGVVMGEVPPRLDGTGFGVGLLPPIAGGVGLGFGLEGTGEGLGLEGCGAGLG